MGVTRIVAASDHSVATSARAIESRSADRGRVSMTTSMISIIS